MGLGCCSGPGLAVDDSGLHHRDGHSEHEELAIPGHDERRRGRDPHVLHGKHVRAFQGLVVPLNFDPLILERGVDLQLQPEGSEAAAALQGLEAGHHGHLGHDGLLACHRLGCVHHDDGPIVELPDGDRRALDVAVGDRAGLDIRVERRHLLGHQIGHLGCVGEVAPLELLASPLGLSSWQRHIRRLLLVVGMLRPPLSFSATLRGTRILGLGGG